MVDKELANKLYQLMIDTDGNPSISQIKELGYSESQALEMTIRMANSDRKKLVEISKAFLEEEN